MSRTFYASGRSAATAVTIDHALAALWNPSATVRLMVREVWICANAAPGAGAALYLRRITARGTPGTTVTPTINNESELLLAPPSGALLDLAAYSAQPTHAPVVTNTAGKLAIWTFAAVAASGVIFPFPRGIEIPAGNGLAIANQTGIIFPASDIVFVWEE